MSKHGKVLPIRRPTVAGMFEPHADAPPDWTAVLWPDSERGPWLIRLLWAPVVGRVECVGVEVRSYRETDEDWPPELPRWDEDPPPLTTSLLRGVPLHTIVTDIRRQEAAGSRELGQWMSDQPEFADAAAQDGIRRAMAAWDLPRGAPEMLNETARVYSAAWRRGEAPTKAVAARFVISESAAAKRVSRARAAGLLPPTTRGRPAAGPGRTQPATGERP